MTKTVTSTIPWMFIAVSLSTISTTVGANIGEPCTQPSDCLIANSTCQNVCVCLPTFEQVNGECILGCGQLVPILNGVVNQTYDSVLNAFVAEYTCNEGYRLVGQANRTCVPPNFEGQPPTCNPIECPVLPPLENGFIEYSETPAVVGSNVTFICDPGYVLNGTAIATCQTDGNFESFTVSCDDVNECGTSNLNTCDSNATCTNTAGSFNCACNIGFVGNGTSCQVDEPIVCRENFIKKVYIELSPSQEEKSICLQKSNTSPQDLCHNPDGDIVYEYMTDTFVTSQDETRFCVEYNGVPIQLICDNITAYDGDTTGQSTTIELCFQFNESPVFVSPTTLSYNVPDMGSERVVALSASDPDPHQNVQIRIIDVQPQLFNSIFTITDNDLTIVNPSGLIDGQADAIVSIEVADDGRPSLKANTNITIQFTFATLSCSASDDPFLVHTNPTPTSPSRIGVITCVNVTTDQALSFTVQAIDGPFGIDATGVIYYDESVSSNIDGEFTATVQAQIQQPVSTVTTVIVNFIVDDFTPACSKLGTGVSKFDERSKAGSCFTPVYTCTERAGVPETCTGGTNLFNVTCDNVSGNQTDVKICAVVDLIARYGNYVVPVNVTNQFGTSELSLDVSVANINDPPTLQSNSSTESISEDTTLGTTIATYTVVDPDLGYTPPVEQLNVNLSYTDDSTDNIPFRVSLNSQQNLITMVLTSTVNFVSKPVYNLRLTVTDGEGLSDFILLTVNILNVNEPPYCLPPQYRTAASVQSPPGFVLATLNCQDPDLDQLNYTLDGNLNVISYFQVNSTGTVSIKNQLTVFTQDNTVLQLNVLVTDPGGLQTQVSISVTISNSVPPQCDTLDYTTSKSEKTDPNTCFNVPTTCRDPVQDETLHFEFKSGNGTQLFRTGQNDNQNNDLIVCTLDSLQDNYGLWQISITANSSYGETQIQLTITVIDQNDPPTFVNLPETINVLENTPFGTTVFTISAVDTDSGILGIVDYQSEGYLEDSDLFTLDRNTGVVTVNTDNIDADDRNLQESYTYMVSAVDGDLQQPKSAVSSLTINLIDLNDNPPVCSPDSDQVTILLTRPVGTLVYQLNCTDRDRLPVYRDIQYTIQSDVNTVFAVNENGTITLLQSLSRDVPQYTIPVLVSDKNNTAFTDNVNIVVNINTAIPPSCTPTEVETTIRETQPRGTCLDVEVKCTDPTGGTLSVQSATGSGAGLLEIRQATDVGSLGINACTNTSLRDINFGTYELIGVITNGLAQTSIRWTFTVTNVNDAPTFDRQVYNVSVNETVGPSVEILQLTATDRDDSMANQTFHLKEVTVQLVNDGPLSDVFLYVGQGARRFFTTGALDASQRNLYKYLATATDGEGLTGTADVYINILDVNSAPICNSSSFDSQTTILAVPGTIIQQLSCYDRDVDPLNVYLDYNIESGDPDGYFNVSETGAVIVSKQLPRTNLYGDRTTSLVIKVSDRGTPSQSTSVIVNLFVDNSIPATCNPVITPPDLWVIDECVTVTMDCEDPTIEGTDHLQYSLSGNYTAGFRLQSNTNGIIVMCYTQLFDANYQLTVSVANGLSVYSKTLLIIVSYEKATPVFNTTKYAESINENTGPNTIILTVKASSSNLIGDLVYRVLESDSFANWDQYFSLDTVTGVISSVVGMRSLADQLVALRIEAEDTGSKLKSSTQVEISIVDINEAPQCTFTRVDQSIDVDINVDTQIIQFNCSDVDSKPEYRQLNYELTGNTEYFALENIADPTHIYVQQQVDVNTNSYQLTLTISDKATNPLSFQRDFNIDVSLVPPPVIVDAVALKYDLIRVNWMYKREAYKTVTNSYKVVLTKNDGTEISSGDLAVTLKNYNMTQLTEKTTYTVIVMANTRYGLTNSSAVVLTTGEIPKLDNFTGTIRIPGIEYSPELRQPSQFYQRTRKLVLDSLDFVLKSTLGYAGVDLRAFRDANSIYADFIVFVNQTGSVVVTIRSLNSSIQSGWLDSLSVDSGYFIASQGDGYILIDDVEQTPAVLINGSTALLRCNIVRIGYSASTTFEYWWTYEGNRIYPTTQSRYSVSNILFDAFPEYAQTELRINPILSRNAGSYSCVAKVTGRPPTVEVFREISVVSQPIVTLTPTSQTFSRGDNVTITCQLIFPMSDFVDFMWFRNGGGFQIRPEETLDATVPTTNILYITGIQNSTVFGCAGVNNAGTGQIVYSNIGVLPNAPTDEDQCEENTDYIGNTWNTTAAGTTSTLFCPQGYTGSVVRICSSEGDWEDPLYNCVKDSIQQLLDDVKDINDGSSSTNISYVLQQLVAETADLDLFNGDIDDILESLTLINQIVGETTLTEDIARQETQDVLQIASNLIAERNLQTWRVKIQQENVGAIAVPGIVEDFLDEVSEYVTVTNGNKLKITKPYIYAEIGRDTRDQRRDYNFPDRSGSLPSWVTGRKTGISIPAAAFPGFTEISYSGSFYRNITSIMVKILKRNGNREDVSLSMDINSEIVSFNVKENVGTLNEPAVITFEHFDKNYSQPICVYWDFTDNAFSTDGCRLVSTSDDTTICESYHLTNFAVLMSPGKTPKADVLALSIISAVGCGISILCLFLTILLHTIVWRLVKSDRSVLLMNLCLALIISYILFLAGVDRAESENVCTVISVLLHFFYLVVFFLMLAYGVEIAVSVIYVFVTRSRIRWLLPLAWGIPAVIVGISIAITQLDGYGNEEFCWLSIESGLLWAFVGPAAFVIVVNLIIVIAVFRKMFKSSAMMTKSDKEKAKTGVRSICVLLPILGLTWVFGIFSVNEDMVVFQYIFTVCNSLQGFFILLFHCIFNNQLRDALKHRSARKKSLASFENSYKNQPSSTTSTSFHSDKSTKLTNTELEIPNSSTNPFLEADRQMKEMVAKTKKGGNLNENVPKNNKVEKGEVNPAVDLKDVKISNILRESEVMGGTAGISSILQTQTMTENEMNNEELRPGERIKHGEDSKQGSSTGFINTAYSGTVYETSQPKPEGYERLLHPQTSKQHGYDKLQTTSKPNTARSFDAVDAEIGRIREWEREKEKEKERKKMQEMEKEKMERQRELERQKEKERQKEAERQKQIDRQREIERERDKQREKERQKEIERQQQMEMDRQRQAEMERKKNDPMVITFEYQSEGAARPEMRARDSREGTYDRKFRTDVKSSRSSRSDDDFEGSAQNISSIKTALPVQYDNKRPQDSPKKTDTKKKDKKDKKKTSVRDRSKAYEYAPSPYESTYLGQSSRHASLENMNRQQYGYSPYAQMPGLGGYQTGNPTHQQMHWDQYRYQQRQQPRSQPRGDYW